MKLSKIFLTVLITPLVAIPCTSIVGCGTEDIVPEDVQQFISDRTFSLMASAICQKISHPGMYYYGAEVFGTGWIIEDSTPTIQNDYCYKVATNWHVTRGFDTLYGFAPDGFQYVETIYCFGDSSLANKDNQIIDVQEYIEFGENNYLQYDDATNYLFNPIIANQGIDFHVCEVNFANATANIKNKLNRVNDYRKSKGYINKFVNGDDATIRTKTKYIGGYPMKKDSDKKYPNKEYTGGKWEYHELDPSTLNYCKQLTDPFEQHYIDQNNISIFPYMDSSAQYTTSKNYGPNWMTGGSSGSMLLTQDFEVCGIYWGGHADSADHPTVFQPRFSLLKTTQYDFITKWL